MRGSDLVAQWWRSTFADSGETTSRKLFLAITALGAEENSLTARAMREGDWSHDQYIAARIANELMLSRAEFASAHGGNMKPSLLESPKQIAERAEQLELQKSLHSFLHRQMTGELVMPARNRGPMVTQDGTLKQN